MGPVFVIAGVGVVALAGAIALVLFIGKGSTHPRRTTWLCVALLAVAFIGFGVLNVAATNYVMPLGWIIGIAIAPIVVAGLAVLIGIDVGWRVSKLVALAGLVVLAGLMFAALGMSGAGSSMVQPLYANRAAQIAQANGFTALLPADLKMPTDAMPVDTLPKPDEGLGVSYEDFWLQERKGTGASEADLEKLVSAGAKPMGEQSQPIPSGGTITRTTVQGQPAVANEYTLTQGGGKSGESKSFSTIVLVFELDGVDVRMSSESGVQESSGEWVPFSNLSVDDLVQIAETLAPVE